MIQIRLNIRWLKYICLFFVVSYVIYIIAFGLILRIFDGRWYVDRKLKGKNLEKVVDEGRTYLAKMSQFGTNQYPVCISHVEGSKDVPDAIRDLQPTSIEIGRYAMLIKLPIPRRASLIIFQTNVSQKATSKITEGLWYWNGDDSFAPKEYR